MKRTVWIGRVADWADRETTGDIRWQGRLLFLAGGVAGAGFLVLVFYLMLAFATLGGIQ